LVFSQLRNQITGRKSRLNAVTGDVDTGNGRKSQAISDECNDLPANSEVSFAGAAKFAKEFSMRNLFVTLVLFLAVTGFLSGSEAGFGTVQLLEGYSAKRASAVDAVVWTIQGKNGLVIHFEAGPSEGRAVDLKDNEKYEWYREQTVNGRKVFLALTKAGVKTDADLDAERNPTPGNILLVTFPLGGSKDHAANFVAKVTNSGEMADALLMALTFNPSKGNF
jgi:hypothetical protein